MKLGRDEHVVTAYAEPSSGPGWSNHPVWVVIRKNGTDEFRMECLQPDEQGRELITLYGIAAKVHYAMKDAADAALRGRDR